MSEQATGSSILPDLLDVILGIMEEVFDGQKPSLAEKLANLIGGKTLTYSCEITNEKPSLGADEELEEKPEILFSVKGETYVSQLLADQIAALFEPELKVPQSTFIACGADTPPSGDKPEGAGYRASGDETED